jgi:glycosyltransferase involved in cell wall biosynthesis
MRFSDKLNKPITVMYLIDTCIDLPGKPSNGGAEKQLYLLASSLNSNLFRPIVVELSASNSLLLTPKQVDNIKLYHLPTQRFYNLHGLRQLSRLCLIAKREKADIIHTFFEKSEVMGWIASRIAHIPIWITSRRDLGFKRKNIYKKIFAFTERNCKKCIANCIAVKDQVVQQEGLVGEKIEVIYNGLQLSQFQMHNDENPLIQEHVVDDGVPLVGMIADFNFEIKGHIYFLGAAKKILEKIPNVKFILVGDGPLRRRYEQVAWELNLKNNVYFLGKRNDVASIISNLDISVLSSTSEGFSNVILESMVAGKPVVATNVGGSKEMILDGITGYLVAPADSQAMANAIINLLQNPEKAGAVGAAGRKVIQERFTVEAMVKKHEELYFSLLEDKA